MVAKEASTAGGGGRGGKHISEDWTRFGKRQILSIGKKRQQIHDDDDEIADEMQEDGHDSSSDEEEGRTSAVREKKRKVRPPAPPPPVALRAPGTSEGASAAVESDPPKKKKKKKGKKERAKENSEDAEQSKDSAADEAPDGKVDDHNKNEATKNDDDGPDKQTVHDQKPKKKRYRKKVRSRQKNIRKDHRSANDKPSRLVPGRADYEGRPLTDETRKRLGLEPAKGDDVAPSTPLDNAFDSGEWVGGEKSADGGCDGATKAGESVSDLTSEPKKDGNVAALMKIGDCIVGSDAAMPDDSNTLDVGEGILPGNAGKMKSKKKKRKFKNLVV